MGAVEIWDAMELQRKLDKRNAMTADDCQSFWLSDDECDFEWDSLSSSSSISRTIFRRLFRSGWFYHLLVNQELAQAYSSTLRVAQRIGYKTGFAKGLGSGAMYFTIFITP
ncbi:hypothetical protein NE237_013255 [Protea cynaroides]|uniref:Uncharacterized protein n=1 Tax=Protea cynaroides TaxID=273540 RepID=A0A9Q0H2L6_9MAGN|nr:hypothetical protein NE237_013255 [Protea cynaroides]